MSDKFTEAEMAAMTPGDHAVAVWANSIMSASQPPDDGRYRDLPYDDLLDPDPTFPADLAHKK